MFGLGNLVWASGVLWILSGFTEVAVFATIMRLPPRRYPVVNRMGYGLGIAMVLLGIVVVLGSN